MTPATGQRCFRCEPHYTHGVFLCPLHAAADDMRLAIEVAIKDLKAGRHQSALEALEVALMGVPEP